MAHSLLGRFPSAFRSNSEKNKNKQTAAALLKCSGWEWGAPLSSAPQLFSRQSKQKNTQRHYDKQCAIFISTRDAAMPAFEIVIIPTKCTTVALDSRAKTTQVGASLACKAGRGGPSSAGSALKYRRARQVQHERTKESFFFSLFLTLLSSEHLPFNLLRDIPSSHSAPPLHSSPVFSRTPSICPPLFSSPPRSASFPPLSSPWAPHSTFPSTCWEHNGWICFAVLSSD